MKFFIYPLLFILLSLSSCNNQESKSAENSAVEQPVIAQVDEHELKAAKERAFSQFNSLEKLFDNANYMMVEGKDTNYLYFSRVNDFLIKTHAYKIDKGDSSDLRIDSIQLDGKNNIKWVFGDKKLALKNTTDIQAVWNENGADSSYYQFQKSGYNTIMFMPAGGKKLHLKKTITLSTFLVRSYYDYIHGTKLAFDTTNFTKK